jgi:hypothetical protein
MKTKYLIVAIFSIFSISLSAKAQSHSVEEVLKCLGREELKIHKMKLGGAYFELNQRLISDFIMFNKIDILAEVKKDICQADKVFGSVKLLEHLIQKGEGVFVFPKKINPMDKEFYKSSIQEFLDTLPEMFLNYVAQIQASTARTQCLVDHIPELKLLYRDLKTFEQEIPARKIMQKNQIASKILAKLRNVDQIQKSCEEEQKKKLEEEKKKRTKSPEA